MQNMQKEIEETGHKEKELFDKFMCYCANNNGALAKSIEDGKARIDELSAKLKEAGASKVQNQQDLAQHKKDRDGAAADLSEATALRDKESAEFAGTKANLESNIKAMAGAIQALEKGMGGASLLQSPVGDRLKHIAESYAFDDESDRRHLVSFLEQNGDYVPQSDQIVGILKNIMDTTVADLKAAVKDEDSAVAGFAELKKSKQEEMTVATQAIETKQTRAGELAVSVAQMTDDVEDTTHAVEEDEKFANQLETQCGSKEKEWAEREKLRSQEIAAISDAIGILNDDDALDLFKKAMPSSLVEVKAGFLQRSGTPASRILKAQAILSQTAAASQNRGTLRLLLFTLSSKMKMQAKRQAHAQSTHMDSGNVTEMIDEMVTIEGQEQMSDDKKQPWCNGEFDKSDREEHAEKVEIGHLDAQIAEEADAIEALNAEITELKAEIMGLDKAVAEATEQRKEEHEDYAEEHQLASTAIELVGKAKNRLNKFYNPVLYKAAPVKKEMTMEEKIIDAGTFVQLRRSFAEPAPAPETFGAYEKSTAKSAGVLGLMDMIVKELEDDMKEAEYSEKTAQKDYEELMTDSAATRSEKAKGIADKEGAKAAVSSKKLQAREKETADFKDVDSIQKYRNVLHGDCDFILENYDARKEARTKEIESLKHAKAMLAGAHM